MGAAAYSEAKSELTLERPRPHRAAPPMCFTAGRAQIYFFGRRQRRAADKCQSSYETDAGAGVETNRFRRDIAISTRFAAGPTMKRE